ncbi:SDR family oxidoreductase [Nonomuraea glycinis]|uniref:SDR family oxidoreductase n=1 Tax=Nonomuraea glycinis TaxID=2047744 RepID=UPI0033ADD27D
MILVTGATGSIGTHLVRRLRQDGAAFRALVRDEAKGRTLGCDFAVGDFEDPGSIAAALDGVDRLFLNSAGALPVDGAQPMIRQQKTAIDAAHRAGVTHVVKVSVWHARQGAKLSQGAHWEIEEHLKTSGLSWSLLQPAGYMQNFLGAGAFTPDGHLISSYADSPVAYIDCHDIAACAAALLTRPHGENATFILTGPQALTDADLAGRISAALRRTVTCVETPPDALATALKSQGLPPWFADDLAVLVKEVAAGSQATTTTAVHDLTRRPPRTFEDFLTAHLPALRALTASSAPA